MTEILHQRHRRNWAAAIESSLFVKTCIDSHDLVPAVEKARGQQRTEIPIRTSNNYFHFALLIFLFRYLCQLYQVSFTQFHSRRRFQSDDAQNLLPPMGPIVTEQRFVGVAPAYLFEPFRLTGQL